MYLSKNGTIYPNPAQSIINVEGVNHADYQIFDIAGQLITSGRLNQQTIDVNNVAPGTYFLRLKNTNITQTFPVIIQK